METVRKKQKTWMYLLVSALVVAAGAVLGTLGMVDYYGAGVLTVFIFYFFHGRKWWCLLGGAVLGQRGTAGRAYVPHPALRHGL